MSRNDQPLLPPPLQCLSLFFFLLSGLSCTCHADIGTASQYGPPYLPTECYGSDPTQFPTNNLFAAAGEGIWDNGASCGRQYFVRCISSTTPGTCQNNQIIQIRIIHYNPAAALYPGATIVLSQTAFGSIANSSAVYINVEFQQ